MKWLFLLLFPVALFALPQGATPVSGQVQVESLSSSKMHIHASDRSVIHWDKFSIGAGETVKFVQPSAAAASFNRVVGGQASQILGMLKANGHVYLINPSGVLIGKSGVINAASFTASTLDLLDHSNGELHFKGEGRRRVINYGRVEALEGDVILIGRAVVNEGELIASKGTVALGAGSEIILRPEAEERLFIVPKLNLKKEEMGIECTGSIQAAKAELKADGNVYKMAINHSGMIEAGTLTEEGGRILLVAERGVVETSGKAIAKGGKVHVLGEKVGLTGEGFIDVSSAGGGGEVLLGGDYQGKGETLRSKLTFVEEGARIDARATEQGDGGKVIAWSDGGTVFFGNVNAEGGPNSGNGGFVEVSGLEHLNFSGLVSTLAPEGKTGTLLLDPTNVTVTGAVDTNATFASGTYTYSAANANIQATALSINLNSSDVVVSTTSTFSAEGTMTFSVGMSWGTTNTLTLISDGDMTMESLGGPNSAGGGDLVVQCGGNLLLSEGAISATASGGDLFITSQGNCTLNEGLIGTADSNISLSVGGDLTLRSGAIPSFISAVTGLISIDVGGNLTLIPSATVPAFIGVPSSAPTTISDIHISRIGGNLSMVAGARPVQIGHAATTSILGNVLIGEIGGDLILQGGTATDAYAQIGHTPSASNYSAVGDVSVGPVGGRILIQGGSGDNAQALIGHGFFGATEDGTLGGSISVSQEVVPGTGNDLLLQSGAATAASAGIGFINSGTASTTVISGGVSVDTNAPITLRTVDGEAQTVIGLFDFNMGSGSVVIEEISVNTSRDLILQAGNGTGSSWGFAAIASRLQTEEANSTINITARDMFWIVPDIGIPIVQNHSPSTTLGRGDVTIKTRNAFVAPGSSAGVDAIISSGRNLTLIADENIVLGPAAILEAASTLMNLPSGVGEITLVVDNAFASSPELGPGRFVSDAPDILPGGALRIFTSRRIQNEIIAPLNEEVVPPAFFSPGPFLIDTPTEQWGAYFPDSFGGFPFAIFYKEALPPFIYLYARAISEMFKNLETYDAFLFAPKCFLLGFDTLCYDEPLHLHGEVSSFDLFCDKTYQMLRPKYRKYQTKYVESF